MVMVKSNYELILSVTSCTCATLFIFVCICYPYFSYNDIDEYSCDITNVEYPTTLPIYGTENKHWIECDCGRYCRSLTPCIKIYSSVKPELIIQDELFVNEPCTFYESSCRGNENPSGIRDSLETFISLAESYINKTVDCYYDKEDITKIYLQGDIPIDIIIICSIILVIYLCCCCCFICYYMEYLYGDRKRLLIIYRL